MKVTINDREINVTKPSTILEVAKENGIHIPHFCYHPMLEQWGGCRMCLVEVEKMPRLQTACTLYVTDGMKIRTESEAISKARRAVLEFILINHPLDCPICDKAGECKLQDYVMKYGSPISRFKEKKLKHPEHTEDPLIVRNIERCIKCTRCVRMCSGVQGASAITMSLRGNHTLMEPFSGRIYECEYCGNCLIVCPVGAIMSKLHRYKYRQWQITKEVKTTCSYCGVGCAMLLKIRENTIMRTEPKIGLGVNKGLLCSRGRFGYEYIGSNERLTTPLVKKNGALTPVSWQEALDTVATRLREIPKTAIAGIAGARCTNEENYVFQKFIRALGNNNIDSIARMGIAGGLRIIESLIGRGAASNPISDISGSSLVITLGGDPTSINPVLGLQIRGAYRSGGKVIVLGDAPGLKRFTTINLPIKHHIESVVISEIIRLIGSANPSILDKINWFKPLEVESTGIDKEAIKEVSELVANASSIAIVVGRDALQRAESVVAISALAKISMAKVYLMAERPNEIGLIDMGCLPDHLPGGVPIELGKDFSSIWGFEPPKSIGLTLMEIISQIDEGSIEALYVMGENPVFNLPNSKAIKNALGKLKLLVVQDIFMTETAEMADIVLPALSWAEKDGTYTNLEGRIQRLKKAVKTENCKEDWLIIKEISARFGINMPYLSASDIFEEIKRVSPLHRNLSSEVIDKGKALWPYGASVKEPEPLSIEMKFTSNTKQGISLLIEKPLFHSGTLSRKSLALKCIYPEAIAKISPSTSKSLGLKDGDMVKIGTKNGSLSLKVRIDKSIGSNILYISNNFEGKGAYELFEYIIEPITKAPLIVQSELSIQKE